MRRAMTTCLLLRPLACTVDSVEDDEGADASSSAEADTNTDSSSETMSETMSETSEDTGSTDTETSSTAPENPEDLCESSGGTWDPSSCGHYECGAPSPDACIDPGCDCGSMANFVEGEGCVEDQACMNGAACESVLDCGSQFLCTFGCCTHTGNGWCGAPEIVSWDDNPSCTVPIMTGTTSWLAVTSCGPGWEELTSCDEGDGVAWMIQDGPWLLTLCGQACAEFEDGGVFELYSFCGD